MDTTTAKIIRKIKGLISTTETDIELCDRIDSAFDAIFADTGKLIKFRFLNEIDYEIFPTIADDVDVDGNITSGRGDLRELVTYRVLEGASGKKQDEKAGEAVKVKSGRDSIDTTNAMAGSKLVAEKFHSEYLRILNDVNENLHTGAYYESLPSGSWVS
jgi:hypothetical protein